MTRRGAPVPAPPAPVAASPPPLLRDPWALVALLSVVPLVLHSLSAPLGEPFADDFDYLHRALLLKQGSFFDGYGSTLYWRPMGRQIYFGLLGRFMPDHPGAIAAFHALVLAAAALLLYRAFRRSWSGPGRGRGRIPAARRVDPHADGVA